MASRCITAVACALLFLLIGSTKALAKGLSDAALVEASPPGPAELEATASRLLHDWAPTFLQHVSREFGQRDIPVRIDFDGDWDATNNWDNLRDGSRVPPAVYGAAILTHTHAYLTYSLFYPRDWMSGTCLPYLCHDNDLEVALVIVERGRGRSADRLAVVETKAHHAFHGLPGNRAARDASGRPVIEVESEGHGMYPVEAGRPVTGRGDTWITLGIEMGRASSTEDRVERYELEPIHDTLWHRRRIDTTNGTLWANGERDGLRYRGERQGRIGGIVGMKMASERYPGGVHPPWALRASAGNRGDWFFDPAFVAARRYGNWLSAGSLPSLTYELNPFLSDLRGECVERACVPEIGPEPISTTQWLGGGGILMLLAVRLTPGIRRPLTKRIWRRLRGL